VIKLKNQNGRTEAQLGGIMASFASVENRLGLTSYRAGSRQIKRGYDKMILQYNTLSDLTHNGGPKTPQFIRG